MARMHEAYGDAGLVIIAVNVDSDQNAAARFLEKYPAEFRLLYDPRGEIAAHFDLETMPSSFLFGRDGVLREQHLGFRDGDGAVLEAHIIKLLKEVEPQ
jgi:peroxiredoxin